MKGPDKNPEMAPVAMAAAKRRRERQHVMFQAWRQQRLADLKDRAVDLRRAMEVFGMQMASIAAAKGEDAVRITRLDWEKFMRQFICQTRVSRFGPAHVLSESEWRQQIGQLCEEYGWQWVDAPKPKQVPPRSPEAWATEAA